jgi:hypothetical protein
MENYIQQIEGASLIKAWLTDRLHLVIINYLQNEYYLQISFLLYFFKIGQFLN